MDSSKNDIVISGMAGRFPKSANIEIFSKNLYNKVDMVDDLETRWKHLNDEIPIRSGKIENLDKFDANFFPVLFKHVDYLDPQSRILLEHAYECITDAGISPKSLQGSKTGVFIGCCAMDSDFFIVHAPSNKDGLDLSSSSRALLSNRISFALDLKGTSFTVDTACSSSAFAFDLAFKAIKNGEIEAALVGGTNLLLHPDTSLQFKRVGLLSQDGTCRSFDINASGYCRAEAINMLFLQKLTDAKRVYAHVLHTRTNEDGFKNEGMMFPSCVNQIKLLEEFYSEIGIDPATIDYVEAHSAGTRVGDPQECLTLDTIFCKNRTKPLLIGSVKSNMGHSEASSTINSIIKALLTFEKGKIPPNLHFTSPRSDIPSLVNGRLQVVSDVQDFNGSLIAVNAFGFGGANSYALFKSNSKEKVNFGIPSDNLPRLILWSGRTENAVETIFDSLVKKPLDAEFVALMQNVQTSTQRLNTFRGFGIFKKDKNDLSNAICIYRHVNNFVSSKRPIVFVYSGMGSQWCGMGKNLMTIPLFESAINKCHEILCKKFLNLKDILTSDDPKVFENVLNSFVGIASIQIGLTDILKAVGIEPDFIIGHSVGELGCAYADGCFTAEEMILSAYSRGMASLESNLIKGSMAAVGVGFKELKNMLTNGVEIACHNSPINCTISGPSELISNFLETLKDKNIFAKEVNCSNIPYHSSYIKEIGSKLCSKLTNIIKVPQERSTKWISSSVAEEKWNDFKNKFSSAEYHTNNLLCPVLFEEASQHLPKNAITIEIAPHGLLQSILKQLLPDGFHVSLTNRKDKENSYFLLEALGKLFENGIDMDVSKLYPPIQFPVSRSTPMISPLIMWDHSESFNVPKYNERDCSELNVEVDLKNEEFNFLSGHEIDGRILFPATGYIFLVWKFASKQHQKVFNNFDVQFEDLKFLRACKFSDDGIIKLKIHINHASGKFDIIHGENEVVTGFVRCAENEKLTTFELQSEIEELSSDDFYKELRLRGYNYKDQFRTIVSCEMNKKAAKIRWISNWITFLDGLLQLTIITKDSRTLFLPIGIRKLLIKSQNHLELANKKKILEVYTSQNLNMIRCGGIEIRGLKGKSVNRQASAAFPTIQSYEFISYFPTVNFTKSEMAQFYLLLITENLETSYLSAIEVDNNQNTLSETFVEVVRELSLITFEFTVVKSINEKISSFSNSNLIITSRNSIDDNFIPTIKSQYDSMFILLRESIYSANFQDGLINEFDIISNISCEDERILLLRFKKNKNQLPKKIIKISNENYKVWLPQLQDIDRNSPSLLYSQNEKTSGILGLVNCIRKEPNGTKFRCVFIDDLNAPDFDITIPFYENQLKKGLSMNVYRDGQWGSYKHFKKTPFNETKSQNNCVYAKNLVRGDLSSIKWIQSPLDTNNNEIIKIHYASLNFRDVMLATGKLIEENEFNKLSTMGFEFSGLTTSGRRVMGVTKTGALATHLDANDALLWDCPPSWTLEEAATVPTVYSTVYAAFFIATKIEKGKSILIHAGSGGVGLAAIRVAFAYGLEVFTTVSTEEKKKYLLSEFLELNEENIGNSRDTSFEDLVMRQTCGKGVDYVLNSLASEKLHASMRCLGQGGKFFEIGRFDIQNDSELKMGEFERELSFFTKLVSNLFNGTHAEKMILKNLLDEDLKKGIIKPLKANVFEPDQIEQAFRYLASGKHMGKVMIKM